jgi:hypothetical protein
MQFSSEEDWLTHVLGTIFQSPSWTVPISSWVDERCLVFDNEQEHKHIFNTLHKEFLSFVEARLEAALKALGLDGDVLVALAAASPPGSRLRRQIDEVMVVDDFGAFKRLMVARNKELEAAALAALAAARRRAPPLPSRAMPVVQLQDDEEALASALAASLAASTAERQDAEALAAAIAASLAPAPARDADAAGNGATAGESGGRLQRPAPSMSWVCAMCTFINDGAASASAVNACAICTAQRGAPAAPAAPGSLSYAAPSPAAQPELDAPPPALPDSDDPPAAGAASDYSPASPVPPPPPAAPPRRASPTRVVPPPPLPRAAPHAALAATLAGLAGNSRAAAGLPAPPSAASPALAAALGGLPPLPSAPPPTDCSASVSLVAPPRGGGGAQAEGAAPLLPPVQQWGGHGLARPLAPLPAIGEDSAAAEEARARYGAARAAARAVQLDELRKARAAQLDSTVEGEHAWAAAVDKGRVAAAVRGVIASGGAPPAQPTEAESAGAAAKAARDAAVMARIQRDVLSQHPL